MEKYNFKKIEKKWQKEWAKGKYKIWHASEALGNRHQALGRKAYVLDMFPYPSGEGLHVGHVEGYTASDIYSRFLRMNGYDVLHPMGWDAFGLPAENYAIKKKIHPSIVVKNNVKNFTRQLNSLGFSYDWQREINTTDPDYYKWTQWIFLQLFKKGLAYEAEIPVNWCPNDKTVLANEEVIDGCCERCGAQVERKKLKQWILKITAYADRLLADLDGLDWPERVKEMQRNWIGRSEGALIKFPLVCDRVCTGDDIEVFTTRPDTIAGATYVVLAPEHPLIKNQEARIRNYEEVKKYIEKSKNKSDRERQENKDKTGVQLRGIYAQNPWNKKEIPVWVSDYVLMNYGTGAIMAVPQHDDRDREFAEKFKLAIVDEPLLPSEEVIKKVGGQKKINYKLRDWIFSRQRYWGEPIPIIYCSKCWEVKSEKEKVKSKDGVDYSLRGGITYAIIPVPEEDLPVTLPKVKNYEPTGEAESPLAGIEKWVKVRCPQCKGWAKRETNTMPQWAGSCWYYLAYLLGTKNLKLKTTNFNNFLEIIDCWIPVDLYLGGVEHAVLHLLYARFWHKVLFDIGAVSTKEPFMKLVNQGLILGPDGQKMSKSKGNVVNPDEMVEQFGADSLRLYEMFMGPLEDAKPWDPAGITGMYRFLNRVFNLADGNAGKFPPKEDPPLAEKVPDVNIERLLQQTIKKVTEDIKSFHFNTAISALMVLSNKMESLSPEFVKLLAPFAPHLAQELWSRMGSKTLLDNEEWPKWDEKLVQEDTFELVVQINGKMRDKFTLSHGISQAEAEKLALAREAVKKWIPEGKYKKVIFVKDRLINFIV